MQTYSPSPSSVTKYNKTDEPSSVFSLPFFSIYHIAICIFLVHTLCLYFSAVYYLIIFSSTHFMLSLPRASMFESLTSTHLIFSLPRARELSLHTPVAFSYSKKDYPFYGRKGRYTRETSDSIIAIMGNRIKCELVGVRNLFRTPTLRL